jgi:tetratricopeptide (TPR) repeat protein
VLEAGRKSDGSASLVALAADRGQAGIVRATALDLLQGHEGVDPDTLSNILAVAARDDDPLVRVATAGVLDILPEAVRIQVARPLLTDRLRAVRIEAARALASTPAGALSPDDRRLFQAALTEYRDAQLAVADMPQAHLNLAILYARQGQTEEAERAYRKAVSLDPYLIPAYANLAQLYNAQDRNAEAEEALREGITRVPVGQSALGGELYYSLGLLLAEEKRLEEAVQALAAASQQLPERARVHYNYGLALQQLGRRREAEAALFKATQIAPQDPEMIYALCIFYTQERRWREALPYAQRLASLAPQAALPQQLVQYIEQALSVTGER